MVIDKTHSRFRATKLLRKSFRATLLVPHAEKIERGSHQIQVRQGQSSSGKASQIMPIPATCSAPAKTHFVKLVGAHFRKLQASLYSQAREAGVVLDAAEPFLGYREDNLAVAHDACCGVVRLVIVDPKRNHS